MKKINYVILFYLLLFVYMFFFTLNCNYVEGDDAATVLYHICGRDSKVQTPYAAYDSGFDFLLANSGLHTEPGLRVFAIMVSFISGFLILALFAKFLEELFADNRFIGEKSRLVFYVLLPFVVPDILFHSLIVDHTYVSFVFILFSLLLFVKFLKLKKDSLLYWSMLFFAIGIPFRWSLLVILPMYLGLAVYFYPPLRYSTETFKFYFKIAIANVIATVTAIYFISLTGYNLKEIIGAFQVSASYLNTIDRSVVSYMAAATAFFTPALVCLMFFGFFKIYDLHKTYKNYWISIFGLIVLAISPAAVIGFFPSFKFLISFVPAIFALAILGFDYIMKRRFLMVLFAIVTIFPWLVGIQLDVEGTACGPGFELNTKKPLVNKQLQNNPDKRVVVKNARLAFDSGFYLPMLEGPRPLYGYLYVLFGGAWKNQVALFEKEREKNFDLMMASGDNVVYFQDRNTAAFQCELYKNGFTTATNFLPKNDYFFRNFSKNNRTITVNIVPDGVSKTEWIKKYLRQESKGVLYNSTYSNEILKLHEELRDSIEVIGPFTIYKRSK